MVQLLNGATTATHDDSGATIATHDDSGATIATHDHSGSTTLCATTPCEYSQAATLAAASHFPLLQPALADTLELIAT